MSWADFYAWRDATEVKSMLSKRCSPYSTLDDGESPCNRALYASAESLKVLLEARANPSFRNREGESLIEQAVNSNKPDCLKLLLDFKGDANKYDREHRTFVWNAVDNNYLDCLKLLLEKRADMNTPDNSGDTPCHIAVTKRKADILKLLVESKADIRKQNKLGETVAFLAAAYRDAECLRLIIAHNGDIRTQDKEKVTPVEKALENADAACLKLLVEAKCDIKKTNEWGENFCYLAVLANSGPCLKILIDAGVDYKRPRKDGDYMIQHASRQEKGVECLRVMLDAKADINQTFEDDYRLYLWHGARLDCLKLLVERRGDVHRPAGGETGDTALIYAAKKNLVEEVRYLVAQGGDLSKENKRGSNPLGAAAENENKECVKLLLEEKADVNGRSNGNSSIYALYTSTSAKKMELFKLLLEKKADINQPGKDGKTIFNWAVQNSKPLAVLKELIALKADVSIPDASGITPCLYLARQLSEREKLELIIQQRPFLDLTDSEGQTALFRAVRQGKPEIVQLLVDAGADVNIPNKYHKKPIDIAKSDRREQIITILQRAPEKAKDTKVMSYYAQTGKKYGKGIDDKIDLAAVLFCQGIKEISEIPPSSGETLDNILRKNPGYIATLKQHLKASLTHLDGSQKKLVETRNQCDRRIQELIESEEETSRDLQTLRNETRDLQHQTRAQQATIDQLSREMKDSQIDLERAERERREKEAELAKKKQDQSTVDKLAWVPFLTVPMLITSKVMESGIQESERDLSAVSSRVSSERQHLESRRQELTSSMSTLDDMKRKISSLEDQQRSAREDLGIMKKNSKEIAQLATLVGGIVLKIIAIVNRVEYTAEGVLTLELTHGLTELGTVLRANSCCDLARHLELGALGNRLIAFAPKTTIASTDSEFC